MIRAMMRKYEDSVHDFRLACQKKYKRDFYYYQDEKFSGLSRQAIIKNIKYHEELWGDELLCRGSHTLSDLDYIIYSLHLDTTDKIFLLERAREKIGIDYQSEDGARIAFLDWIERALDDLRKLQNKQFSQSQLQILQEKIRGEINEEQALTEIALLEAEIAHKVFEDDPNCDYREILDKWADIESNVNHLSKDEIDKEWKLLVQDLEARISPYGLHAHDIYKLYAYKEAWQFQNTIEDKPTEPATTAEAPEPEATKEEPEPMGYFADFIGSYLSVYGNGFKVEGKLTDYLKSAFSNYDELSSEMLFDRLYKRNGEKISNSVIKTTLSKIRKGHKDE